MNHFDVIIVGAGPIGINCAIEAKKYGLNTIIIEKGVIVNSLFHFPVNMTFFSTSNLLEIGDVPFIAHADKPTRREALEYYRRVVESWQLNIRLYEEVKEVKSSEKGHVIMTSKGEYRSHSVIIATGFYDTPRMLNIPGEQLPKVKHYYDEPHPYIGQKLAIIGAGNSACDVALETYHKGADVTMIVRKDQIKPTVKYWIKPNIENRLKEGSIKSFFNSNVVEIREKEIAVETPEGLRILENDFVLAMTGYQPKYEMLARFGITFNDDEFQTPIHNPVTLESDIPNIYIAGVLLAGKQTSRLFIENTRIHAGIITSSIADKIKNLHPVQS